MMATLVLDDDNNGVSESTDGTTSPAVAQLKLQRKEEGKRRALEIAMAKQRISNNTESDVGKAKASSKNATKRANRKSARHGARNQHRHKHFARWILEKFPHVLTECCVDAQVDDELTSSEAKAPDPKPTKMHILDVAGGKGELSARLSLCHSLNVVMIDPRSADIASVYMNDIVPKLPNKWQKSLEERLQKSPTFVSDELKKRFTQLVVPFPAPSQTLCEAARTNTADEVVICQFEENALDAAVRNACLLIGLHADGATEAIVDAALLYRKPFVVVPCCVSPNLFRERFIRVPIDDKQDDENSKSDTLGAGSVYKEQRVPVRTHDQFCNYLLAKDPRFVMEVLPFDGRNVAIWWDGQ